MISKRMDAAINTQINEELYSAYLYLAMSAYCQGQNLPGFAKWLEVQHKEETSHAMKFYGYLLEQGATVRLQAIQQPPASFKEPLNIFEAVLKHEKHITRCIGQLMDLAVKEGDYASQIMLQWFVKEQVEEEANDSLILAKLRRIGASGSGLTMLDKELGKRGAA